MKSAFFCFVLLLLPSLAFGQADIRDRKVDGNSSVSQYNSGRMADLPSNEADKLYITLTTSDDWQADPRQRQIASWFNTDPRLLKYRQQMRFNWYTLSNPLFKSRLQKYFGTAVPIVSIQKPNGNAVMNVTGLSMPRSAGELADMIADSVEAHYSPPTFAGQTSQTPIEREDCPDCPDGNCPPLDRVDPIDGLAPIIPEIKPFKPFRDGMHYMVVAVVLGALALLGLLILAVVIAIIYSRRAKAPSQPTLY